MYLEEAMFTLLIGKGLELALVERSFAAKYLEIVEREREYLSQWLAWPPHADCEDFFVKFINQSLHDYADNKSLVCAMIFDGEIVGNVSLNTIDHSLKKVEIGYWLSSAYQGQGLVSRSVSQLIDIAFTDLEIDKVQISVAVDNAASRKVCERLGFCLVGIRSQAENLNGRLVDHAVYTLLRNN